MLRGRRSWPDQRVAGLGEREREREEEREREREREGESERERERPMTPIISQTLLLSSVGWRRGVASFELSFL